MNALLSPALVNRSPGYPPYPAWPARPCRAMNTVDANGAEHSSEDGRFIGQGGGGSPAADAEAKSGEASGGAEEVKLNIRKGKAAIMEALLNHRDVHAAMQREGLGDITFA